MVQVELNLLNIFQLRVGKRMLVYEGNTVGDIISKFLKEHQASLDAQLISKNKKKLNKQMVIILNGRNIEHLKTYDTKLSEGDKLYISAPLAGG
ncbi:MAG: MoaD/ThiS family protein [Promethearchaeota archaeon]